MRHCGRCPCEHPPLLLLLLAIAADAASAALACNRCRPFTGWYPWGPLLPPAAAVHPPCRCLLPPIHPHAALATHPYVYMRWQERCFLPQPTQSPQTPAQSSAAAAAAGLSISGFYYVCLHRASGAITGLYNDPTLAPALALALALPRSSSAIAAAGLFLQQQQPDQRLDLMPVLSGPQGYAFPHYDMA